ncbi:imidazole glycerol phosphate synthase subunit HisH [Shewanella indica]|uniref:imidazole glycerol phosphate synthase subunit HisH n=1 Tax=Shewanella indica TaxID=768528 RepID=UPI00313CB6AB
MITIVDYGLGNIRAFTNVYKRLNIDTTLASNVDELKRAKKIILPGVGAFDHAMKMLNDSGMRECLDTLVLQHEVPVIGICVGMQMMASASEEGSGAGLGWIDATVKRFDYESEQIALKYPLPHMGWNNISMVKDSLLLKDLDQYMRFYFLHSYYFQCNDADDILATANYGFDYSCIVQHNNIYGIQCHPEKSHHNGVTLLKNFAGL